MSRRTSGLYSDRRFQAETLYVEFTWVNLGKLYLLPVENGLSSDDG